MLACSSRRKASIMSVAEFGFLRELASTIPDVNGKDDNDNGNSSGDPYSDGGQQPTSSSATSSAADIAHRDHHHHHNVRPNSHHPLLDLPSSSSIYAHHHHNQDHSTPTSTTTIPTNQSLNNLTQFLHGPPIDLSSSPHHDKNNNSIRALAPSTSSMFVPMSVATATTASVVPKPAAKRGRPRKRPLPEESIVQKPVAHPIMVCFSATGDGKKVSKTSKSSSSSAPQPPPPSSTFAGPLNLSSKPSSLSSSSSKRKAAPRPPPPAIEEYDDEETEEDEPGRWLENGDDTEEDNDDDDTPIAGLSGRYGASTSFTPAVRPAHTSVGSAGHDDDDDEDYDS